MGNGAEWIKKALRPNGISPLGEAVADLLDDVFQGIYHLDLARLQAVDWGNNDWIEIALRGGLSTFDSSGLTALVVFCHDRMLRMEISGHTHGYLRLEFHQRKGRTGQPWYRHPDLESHAKILRAAAYQNEAVN